MSNEIQFILYQLPDEEGKVQVVIKDETIWATQKAMAQLFGVGVPAISKHLAHIFDDGELDKDVVVSKMEIATQHGAIEGKTQKSETAFINPITVICIRQVSYFIAVLVYLGYTSSVTGSSHSLLLPGCTLA